MNRAGSDFFLSIFFLGGRGARVCFGWGGEGRLRETISAKVETFVGKNNLF